MIAPKLTKINPKQLNILWNKKKLIQRFPLLEAHLHQVEEDDPVQLTSNAEESLWGLQYSGRYASLELFQCSQSEQLQGRSHPLFRILLKSIRRAPVLIVDATAGFLGDTVLWWRLLQSCLQLNEKEVLEHVGQSKLLLFERDPWLWSWYQLLALSHKQAPLPQWNELLLLGDTSCFDPHQDLLQQQLAFYKNQAYELILFYDPIFEYQDKKSAPNQQLQILRALEEKKQMTKHLTVNEWEELSHLFNYRIIKRTSKAPELYANLNHQLHSLLLRWDVYI